MAPTNRERVGAMIELLRDGLRPFVEREMREEYKGAWLKQAAYSIKGGLNESDPHLDSSALIIIMQENWDPVFKQTLGYAERALLSELREVRNRYAHEKPFSTDDAYRALDSGARLLNAVSAPEAREVERMKQELLRLQFEEQQRAERRKAAALPLEGLTATSLRPWREVIEPHPDVAAGQFLQAEFAADLWQVHQGEGVPEYSVPSEFFARTYLTEGLRTLLTDALASLAGAPGGNPVINLKTNFGGGKTHSMLALYHLFSGAAPGALPGVEELVKQAGAPPPAQVRRVVLVGNKLSPGQPGIKPDGTEVRTLWGELAWQVGGAQGYAMVRRADETGTNPGAALTDLLRAYAPCLILIDEWVAYARQLHDAPGLPGGTLDTQLTFAQTLTEAIKGVPRTLLVVSLPASDIEVGGQRGQTALARITNIVARVDNPWRPASQEESYEIVRRRLFQAIPEERQRDRDAVVARFGKYYRDQPAEFPSEARERAYEERLRNAYPIHPELFDRLYTDWSSLERFQRTRGVLRLMAKVIHALWIRGDGSPLILPAHVPMDDSDVQQELTRYLEDNWVPIIEHDVDGASSIPLRLDKENPTLGRYSACRRVARTVFLGSAPTLSAHTPGIEAKQVKLGVAQPGEAVSTFGDALSRLGDQAMHLYVDRSRYWYSTRPSVARLAQDRAAQAERDDVWAELINRLRGDRQRGDQQRGRFGGVHVAPRTGSDVPDDDGVRLVVLGPETPHVRRGLITPAQQQAELLLRSRGSAPRLRQNMLLFLAPDADQLAPLEDALRSWLAWSSICAESERLNLDAFQNNQARTRLEESDKTVTGRMREAFIWLLAPTQADPAAKTLTWQEIKLQGSEPLAQRAEKALTAESQLLDKFGGLNLRMEMDKCRLWGEGNHVAVQKLWEYFTCYPYLPRLLNRDVLLGAIQNGIARVDWGDYFAYADGYSEEKGGYTGLLVGANGDLRCDGLSVVVKPDVARAQIERERVVDPLPLPGPGPGPGPQPPPPPPPPPGPAKLTRYHASVTLNSTRVGANAGQIAEEVIAHLVGLEGASVTVTLEIDATIPAGAPDNVVRIVTENGKTLKFASHGFERE